MKSKFLTLNKRDIFRGAIVAGLSAGAGAIVDCLNRGTLPSLDTLRAAGAYAAAAAIGYLIKNLLTNSAGEILKGEK